MRVAIDARELLGRPTGVGRYLACLLDRWRVSEPGTRHQFQLYVPEPLPRPQAHAWLGSSMTERIVPGGRGTWWEQIELARALRRDRPDVLFAPAYTSPLRPPVPTVLTVHDVSFIAHPEWFTWREGLRRRWITRRAARGAKRVITVSQFSAAELVRHLGIPRDRLRVVYSGVPVPGEPTSGDPASHAPDGPVVLYVGAIFNRRHVPALIRAFSILLTRLPTATLVIVGENRTHPRQDLARLITESGGTGRVQLASYVDQDQLNRLYRSASAFVFLSEYEGFGLPPLEALASGVPAVLGDTPTAREICGDAALYVPIGDDVRTGEALLAVLTDTPVRRRLLAAAPGVLARYSWDRAAHETLGVIEEAAGPAR